jgi:membrane protease YdiL (CAAX protease family)
MIGLPMRRWTVMGLAIALFSMPLAVGLFTALQIPLTAQNVLLREIILFAFAATLLLIIRNKEHLPWVSVGLNRPPLGNTALWVAITLVGVVLAGALAFGIIKLFKLPVGSSDSQAFDALPKWVMLVVIIRAGFVEELFYRGYAIERLRSLTGSRILCGWDPAVDIRSGALPSRSGWDNNCVVDRRSSYGCLPLQAKPLDHNRGAFPGRLHPEYPRALFASKP